MKKGNRIWRVPGVSFAMSILLSVLIVPTAALELDVNHLQTGQAHPQAVIPYGWRLTKNGWEHTSTWTLSNVSINQLIAAQHEREPAWIRLGFSKLRSIPPLMVALLQVTAIAVIMNISKNHRRRAAG